MTKAEYKDYELVERPIAKWEQNRSIVYCSDCKKGIRIAKGAVSPLTYRYCPWCGASMKGEQQKNDNEFPHI